MYRKIRIKLWDWLLIFGAVLAPMTGLRIWKIGPAEVLCFIWALRYISFKKLVLDEYVRFFLLFMIGMFFGTLVCVIVAREELSINGWATWFYLGFIACILLSHLRKNSLEYNVKLFDIICQLSVLWYLFLYVYSLTVSRSFLGAPLWYSSKRFSGGGTNPHQIAVLLCGIAFWFTYKVLRRERIVLNLLFFAAAVFLETRTRSSTGTASIFLGVVVLLIIVTSLRIRNSRTRAIMITAEVVLGLLMAVIFYRVLYRMIYEWIADDSNGVGRLYIWASFGNMFKKSPILGLGPGEHALTYVGNMKEFHNSYLEIYAASGILGFAAFVALSVKLFKTVARGSLVLLPALISVYVYSMAGFAMRRLIYWIVVTFAFVIAEQQINSNQNETMGATDVSEQLISGGKGYS